MKVVVKESKLGKILILLFFLITVIEILTQIYADRSIQYIIKPIMALILMVLYWCSSKQKALFYFIAILSVTIGRLLIINANQDTFFYGMVAILIYRMIQIYFVIKIVRLRFFIPIILATIPFFIILVSLISITSYDALKSNYMIINYFSLISIICGISLSHYIINFEKKDIWLYIFALFSITQAFIFYIEKVYLINISIAILRPLAMLLNSIVCIAFYKFVLSNERIQKN